MKKISVDVFDIDVAVFRSDRELVKDLRKFGVNVAERDRPGIASAHVDIAPNGLPLYSMVIKKGAKKSAWAHECSHMADFICDTLGIPVSIEATEVRAYLVGHLFSGLEDLLE